MKFQLFFVNNITMGLNKTAKKKRPLALKFSILIRQINKHFHKKIKKTQFLNMTLCHNI